MNTQKQAVVPFNFGEQLVRTTMIDGELWFVAKDVCDILEHTNSRMALEMLDDDEKGVSKVYTLGGDQGMNIINESGLYHLIIRSNKPEAKAFRKWVTSVVLPSIRKKGYYGADREGFSERKLKMLLTEYARKTIGKSQFCFLIGMPPTDFQIEETPHPKTQTKAFNTAVVRDDVRDFVKNWFCFEKGAAVVIREAFIAYLNYYGFENNDIDTGEAVSPHKFTRWILADFGGAGVEDKVCRVHGKPARCFYGLRFRTDDELEAMDEKQEG